MTYYTENMFGIIRYLMAGLLLVSIASAKAQEPARENSFAINGWTSIAREGCNHFGLVDLSHEWKPCSYLGLDLGGGFGWLSCYDLQKTSAGIGAYEKLYLREMSGSFRLVRGKLTAYLPVWRDDDDVTRIQGFVSMMGGVTGAISLDGSLEYYKTGQAIKASSKSDGHFFRGFEIGLWGSFSRHWAMKLYLGGNNIQFDKAVKGLDAEVGNFPVHFDSHVPNAYSGFSLIYTY